MQVDARRGLRKRRLPSVCGLLPSGKYTGRMQIRGKG
nr:MAG TPA_asm: hypothetical protein [Caudoviricetes sp.]